MPRLWIVPALALVLACSGQPASSPPATSAPVPTVTSNNRLSWDQAAADAVELATFRYAIYVDGVRSEMTGVSCATVATDGKYACTAPLPAMSPGSHFLEMAAFIMANGNLLESPRSPGIQVVFTPATPGRPSSSSSSPGVPAAAPHASAAAGTAASPASAVAFVSHGLEQISDLAFTDDGRLFIAERTGRIRIVRDGTLLPVPALEVRREPDAAGDSNRPLRGAGAVLSIAIDPQFDRTHLIYVLSTAASRRGTLAFLLARYREAGDKLADRAVLLDEVPAAATDPAGAVRFGPDGKLYVALDAAGDVGLSDDLASPNGKVLRLNGDGTTPDDQAAASPLYSSPYHSPRGLDWDEDSGIMWIVDAAHPGVAQVNAVEGTGEARRKRGVTKSIMELPQPDQPSALLFVNDSVLVGFARGAPLLRGRVAANDPSRIVHTEPLLQDTIDSVQALALGPDGAVYFATADAVGRLSVR